VPTRTPLPACDSRVSAPALDRCPPWLDEVLASYGDDLASLLAALERLVSLARSGREAAARNDADTLLHIVEERTEASAQIASLEPRIAALRRRIAEHIDLAGTSLSFPAIASRHREGEQLVNTVLALDRETLASLDHAERHRRDVALAIEAGEATLAAYRKVVAPPPFSAGLIDRRG